METIEKINRLLDEGKNEEAEKLLDSIAAKGVVDELKEIIYLYQRLQKYGKAINVCNQVLEAEPGNQQVLRQKELLNEILKFTQLDIYASTNLWNDPWFE